MALAERRKGMRSALRSVDGFLITDMVNVRYLSGFTGSSGFIILSKGKGNEGVFVSDFRYALQAEREVKGLKIYIEKRPAPRAVGVLARKLGIRNLGVEDTVSVGLFNALKSRDLRLKAFRDPVRKLRAIKDAGEVASIREAVRRAEAAFLEVRPYIRAGRREREVAWRLEERLRKKGCRRIPFDIIVASGPNSALPHARAAERRMAAGDLVVVDWGGEAGGYFSDMTRTLLIRGKDTARKREIHRLVFEAQRKAIRAVRPGVSSLKIDSAARDVIKKAGHGRHFGHGLGHGVGLEVHELPRISPARKDRVKEGMVFTVEPGVYVPGLGGVRVEDMVLVKQGGAEMLTSIPRRLDVAG